MLIFDGLDELAMQGKIGSEVAQQFVREVQKQVERFNQRELKLQVLLSGRDVVVQTNSSEFRKEGKTLYVLPYVTPKLDDVTLKLDYDDQENLLAVDLRNQWWQNYGVVKGFGYDKLPEALAQDNLVEITAQPLLNYLVALSYDRGTLKVSRTSNLNEIYKNLLEAIYARGWANKRQHPTLRGVDFKDFVRVLEEVALAAWHGDGRTTTVKEIEAHCDSSGLAKLLEIFQEGAKSGVTKLLTAFYFRQSGGVRDTEKTFEFTHKSFGEYLTACRIVRGMKRIHNELEWRQEDLDSGWDERQALKHWAELCGPSVMDRYVFSFLCDEIRSRPVDQVSQWQKTFCQLIEVMLRQGMLMELLGLKNYHEQSHQARNSEEALLVSLNACARLTNELSQINWPTPEAFSTWVARLQGQRIKNNNFLIFDCFGLLDLHEVNLLLRDLLNSDLSGANLSGANLVQANLEGTNLLRAKLSGANLMRVKLAGSNLLGADLSGADLSDANLSGANLTRTNLSSANLLGTNLSGANLVQSNLLGANLLGANLESANLMQSNLLGANLIGANLESANLESANLMRTDLVRANLLGANLVRTNLSNISWNTETIWKSARSLDCAIGVPKEWLATYKKP